MTLTDQAAYDAVDRKLERVRKLKMQSWRIVLVGYGHEVREVRIEEAQDAEKLQKD